MNDSVDVQTWQITIISIHTVPEPYARDAETQKYAHS